MKLTPLTPAEEQLMQVIWRLDRPYLREIMQALPEPKSHQNTVSTYLKILTEKHYLNPQREGRIFRYHVLIEKPMYAEAQLERLIDDFFEGSAENLRTQLGAATLSSDPMETALEKSTRAADSLEKPLKKKQPSKKYKAQIADFVTGLDLGNKKVKKAPKKKKKDTKEKTKAKAKDKPAKKAKELKPKAASKSKEKPSKN